MEEAAQALGGFILWGIVIVVALGLLLWLLAIAVGSAVHARKTGHKKPKAPIKVKKVDDHPVVAHPDPHHPATGGGGHDHHDGHDHGGGWVQTIFNLLIAIAVLVLLGLAIIWLHERSVREIQNNTTYSVGRARTAQALATQGLPTSVRVTPPDVISCSARPKIVLKPGQTIHLDTDGKKTDFTPYTSEGTLRACNYHSPGQCTSPTTVLRGDIDVLSVTNITEGADAEPVELECWYY